LAKKLENFEKNLPDNIKMAYLPSPEDIKIRLWAFGGFQKRICQQINDLIADLQTIIGENIFGYDNDSLETVIAQILKATNKTIATAESCTGGRIAHTITSVSGSSEYFKGGIVAYSNQAKINTLNVKNETVEKFGAVSQQVVEEMAIGAVKLFDTDYAIATSGIAGPTGGTDEKPVGTTWIAVANKNTVVAKKYTFGTRRDINIRRATATALFDFFRFMQKSNS